jgi:hypothetical protein
VRFTAPSKCYHMGCCTRRTWKRARFDPAAAIKENSMFVIVVRASPSMTSASEALWQILESSIMFLTSILLEMSRGATLDYFSRLRW